jgi:hypothetical protein
VLTITAGETIHTVYCITESNQLLETKKDLQKSAFIGAYSGKLQVFLLPLKVQTLNVGRKERKRKEIKTSAALVREKTIPSDRHLSAKFVPTFADRGCHAVRATDPHGLFSVFQTRAAVNSSQ